MMNFFKIHKKIQALPLLALLMITTKVAAMEQEEEVPWFGWVRSAITKSPQARSEFEDQINNHQKRAFSEASSLMNQVDPSDLPENQDRLAVQAMQHPEIMQELIKGSTPTERALIFQNIGRRLINQELFQGAYTVISQINISDLPPEHLDDFYYNLTSSLIGGCINIPGKTPEEALKTAWNIVKAHHKTSMNSFIGALYNHESQESKKRFNLNSSEWLTQAFKRGFVEIISIADPFWGPLCLFLFQKLGDQKYSKTLSIVFQEIFEGDPNEKLYIPFQIALTVFKNHPEFLRMQRECGMMNVPLSSKVEPEEKFLDMLTSAKQRLDKLRANFQTHMRKRVVPFAIQELKTLGNEDPQVNKKLLEKFTSEGHANFAQDLIHRYGERLFPSADADMKEWLQNMDKNGLEKILVEEILPKVHATQVTEMALRIKRIVYNRLAILMRDQIHEIKEMQAQIPNFNYDDDVHLKQLARSIVAKFEDDLFATLPKNDLLTQILQEYKLSKKKTKHKKSKKNEIVWKCLKAIFSGEEV